MDASTLNYYMSYFDQWAGLPVGTLRALAMKESSYNPRTGQFRNVCNWVRACGLMQLRPIALEDIRRNFNVSLNPLDPIQAIIGAAALMIINRRYIQNVTKRNPDIWALVAAYNGGYGAGVRYMNRQSIPYETQNYMTAFYNNFRQSYFA